MLMFFSELPDELKLRIFSYCDIPTLGKNASVSKEWQRLTSDDSLWQQQFTNLNLTYQTGVDHDRTYKAAFKDCYLALNRLVDQLYDILYSLKQTDTQTSLEGNSKPDVFNKPGFILYKIDMVTRQALYKPALFTLLLKKFPTILTKTDELGNHALHWFSCGHPEAVKLLLAAHAAAGNSEQALVNTCNYQAYTPLNFALVNCPSAKEEDLKKVIEISLAYGANLSIADKVEGKSFLDKIESYHATEIISAEYYSAIINLVTQQPTLAVNELKW